MLSGWAEPSWAVLPLPRAHRRFLIQSRKPPLRLQLSSLGGSYLGGKYESVMYAAETCLPPHIRPD